MEPYAALVIGGIGALVYIAAAMFLPKLKMNDPLEAFPIHGAGGVWGTIAVGLFNRKSYVVSACQSVAQIYEHNFIALRLCEVWSAWAEECFLNSRSCNNVRPRLLSLWSLLFVNKLRASLLSLWTRSCNNLWPPQRNDDLCFKNL